MKRLFALALACGPVFPGLAADFSAGGASFSVPVASMREARFRSTVHQQYDFSCGSAALATLLTYHYGMPVSEQQAFVEMFASGDQARIRRDGFSMLDMKRFLAARGLVADGFQQPLEKLANAGLPAIVLLSENGYNHFVVIKGVQGGRVLLGDPSGGTRAMARAAFDAAWQNKLLFVIHGQAGKPRFNEASDWRVAPQALAADVLPRDHLQNVSLPKLGATDF